MHAKEASEALVSKTETLEVIEAMAFASVGCTSLEYYQKDEKFCGLSEEAASTSYVVEQDFNTLPQISYSGK